MQKNISNAYSTGGGGSHFEAHIQASFVVLMLTGGFAPYLPCWPVSKVLLQVRAKGFHTDDLIVFVKNKDTHVESKMLAQVKSSIQITNNDVFKEVVEAAWKDFNNETLFSKGKDRIALITGPINRTDQSVINLLQRACHTMSHDEFFTYTNTANAISENERKKLSIIKKCIVLANDGQEVQDQEVHDFLRHFNLLGYDVGDETGVVLSLIQSHISQFNQQTPKDSWARIVEFVKNRNQHAGEISYESLPEDIKEAFTQRKIIEEPVLVAQPIAAVNEEVWENHQNARELALLCLIGTWCDSDGTQVADLLGVDKYEDWLSSATKILNLQNSCLSFKNGVWEIVNRKEFTESLGSYLNDSDLNNFKNIALSVLSEKDPSFELPVEQRYMASMNGKVLTYSQNIRNGIAEGLALIANNDKFFTNVSHQKVNFIVSEVIRSLFKNSSYIIWGSLNNLLPSLAESSPEIFLQCLENSLKDYDAPFEQLFSQEGDIVFGKHYMTGLLSSLEALAWSEKYFSRACIILGELASKDPGGTWSNRPERSLLTILLPWCPQTLASAQQRIGVFKAVYKDHKEIMWPLLLKYLPNSGETSYGTYQPKWIAVIPEEYNKELSQEEYWEQANFYADLSVKEAMIDNEKLTDLIDNMHRLPESFFNSLIDHLNSNSIKSLSDKDKLRVWQSLSRQVRKNTRFKSQRWVLPKNLLSKLEESTEALAPSDPYYKYQVFFTSEYLGFMEDFGVSTEERNRLLEKRKNGVKAILDFNGVDKIFDFATSVNLSFEVGYALAILNESGVEECILPLMLGSEKEKVRNFIKGFTQGKYREGDLLWLDSLSLKAWDENDLTVFLSFLPFEEKVWTYVTVNLNYIEEGFYSKTEGHIYSEHNVPKEVFQKLIKYGRSYLAIDGLHTMLRANKTFAEQLYIDALRGALSSNEKDDNSLHTYSVMELIKFLQSNLELTDDRLISIEWAYLSLFNENTSKPLAINNRLASDPEFFHQIITTVYKSTHENKSTINQKKENKSIFRNAYQLLTKWDTPPGMSAEGAFNEGHFNSWIENIIKLSDESGHLDVALIATGKVLTHSPKDPSGLWIHKSVAKVLNNGNNDCLRTGYEIGVIESRGVYSVDPTGQQELELAEKYNKRASSLDEASYTKFATTLRKLANIYKSEACKNIDEYAQ